MTNKTVSHEHSTLRSSKVGAPHLESLVVVRFVNDADSGSTSDTDSNERSYVGHVTLSEAFCTVKWINPNLHFVFVKLVWKLIIVEISLWRSHSINLLQILQMAPISVFVQIEVVDQHFLTDLIFVKLVRHDVGLLLEKCLVNFVFFSDYGCSGIQLLQVVYNSVLDMDIRLSKHIVGT